MYTPTEAAGTLLFNVDSVLLIEHTKYGGGYGIPGGKVERGENTLQTAIRELREETGLCVEERFAVKLPEVYVTPTDLKMSVYYFEKFSGTSKNSDEGPVSWVKTWEIESLNSLPHLNDIVRWGIRYRNSKA